MSRPLKGLRFHPTRGGHGCWEKTHNPCIRDEGWILLMAVALFAPVTWAPAPTGWQEKRHSTPLQAVSYDAEGPWCWRTWIFSMGSGHTCPFLQRKSLSLLYWKTSTPILALKGDITSLFQGCSYENLWMDSQKQRQKHEKPVENCLPASTWCIHSLTYWMI